MPRNVSALLKQAAFAEQTDEVVLCLMTIDHPDMVMPLRVSSDSVNTTSRGDEFIAYPFQIVLPDDPEVGSPRAKLIIDNVARDIVQAVRSLTTTPTVLIELVMASQPDTVEVSWPGFQFDEVRYDRLEVSGDLTLEDFTAEPYPSGRFTPAEFEGLF